MKVLMLVVFFVLLSGFYIVIEEGIEMNSFKNIEEFAVLYGKWFDNFVDSGKIVSSYVVKMEWLPASEG